MGSTILDIATSALRVTQNALTTTGQNIANVNTEGYSRQRVLSSARDPQFSGAGFLVPASRPPPYDAPMTSSSPPDCVMPPTIFSRPISFTA